MIYLALPPEHLFVENGSVCSDLDLGNFTADLGIDSFFVCKMPPVCIENLIAQLTLLIQVNQTES